MKINPTFYKWFLDPFERAGSTFVQQFVAILAVTGGVSLLLSQDWLLAADTAGFAGLIALGTSYIGLLLGLNNLTGAADLWRRTGLTFLQSLFGTLAASVVDPSVVHAPWLGALALAIIAALTAFAKGLIGLQNTRTRGASVIPIRPKSYPVQPPAQAAA